MRILLVTPTFHPTVGGIETYLRTMGHQLVAMGHICQIAEINTHHASYARDELDGITVHRIPAFGIRQAIRFDVFFDKVGAVDVINVNDPHQAGLSWHFVRHRGRYGNVRLMLTTHGGFFHTSRLGWIKQLYFRLIVPHVLKRYDRVLCISKTDYQRYLRIAPARQLALVENGIEATPFERIADLDGSPHHFVYYGRIARNKNVPILIRVFAQLARRVDIRLHIVGDGDELDAARQAASDAPVMFHPFLDGEGLLRLLSTCRYFVTATSYEGFGLSIVEAMTAGRIVIANDIPVLRHLVQTDRNGFLVDFHTNPVDTAERIRTILTMPEPALQSIRDRARTDSQQHSWEAKRDLIHDAFSFDS